MNKGRAQGQVGQLKPRHDRCYPPRAITDNGLKDPIFIAKQLINCPA